MTIKIVHGVATSVVVTFVDQAGAPTNEFDGVSARLAIKPPLKVDLDDPSDANAVLTAQADVDGSTVTFDLPGSATGAEHVLAGSYVLGVRLLGSVQRPLAFSESDSKVSVVMPVVQATS